MSRSRSMGVMCNVSTYKHKIGNGFITYKKRKKGSFCAVYYVVLNYNNALETSQLVRYLRSPSNSIQHSDY